jgi:hypothetical protein
MILEESSVEKEGLKNSHIVIRFALAGLTFFLQNKIFVNLLLHCIMRSKVNAIIIILT